LQAIPSFKGKIRMKRFLLMSAILFAGVLKLQAQVLFEYQDYDWDAKPIIQKIDTGDASKSAVILKDLRVFEFVSFQNNLITIETMHKIIRVNDDKGVEQYGRVYLPIGDGDKLIKLKARAISPAGKITDMDLANVKEITEPGNLPVYYQNKHYQIFALEGVEKGGEVEYFYSIARSSGHYRYGSETIQSDEPAYNVHIEIIAPDYLIFKTKGYNGFPHIANFSSAGKSFIKVDTAYMPGLVNEPYSDYNNNLAHMEYKLQRTSSSSADLYTFENAATTFSDAYHTKDPKKLKRFYKLIKQNKWDALQGETQIKAIESYIKENISEKEGGGPEFSDPEKILKNKYGDQVGIMRIYSGVFDRLGIKFQIVMTAKRKEKLFDETFDSWDFLEDILLYFPSVNKYINPADQYARLDAPPPEYVGNKGLFIEEITIGKITSAIPRIKIISPPPYTEIYQGLKTNIRFTDDFDKQNLDVEEDYGGYEDPSFYPGLDFKSAYKLIDDDKKKEVLEDIFKAVYPDAKVISATVENTDIGISKFDVPLVLKSKVSTGSLIEKGGNQYIFKIGVVIGPQDELYDNKEPRKFDIVSEYPRLYLRNISFEIPDGYKVENLSALKIDKHYIDGQDTTLEFKSDYTLNGNTVNVKVTEYYAHLGYPKEVYPIYREVINASADFNKVKLVFRKK